MVKVMFGKKLPDTIKSIDNYFNNSYQNDWFDDKIVKQMILDVDKSEINGTCVISEFLGNTSVENLSGGVKALIVLLKDDELEFPIDLAFCGKNCQKWLSYIFSIRDVTVCMTGVHLLFENLPVSGICLNNGNKISNSDDWHKEMINCLEDYNK